MTKGFAPILKLAVKSQAKRAEKRQLTPLGKIQANLLNYVAELPDPRVQRTQKHLLKQYSEQFLSSQSTIRQD